MSLEKPSIKENSLSPLQELGPIKKRLKNIIVEEEEAHEAHDAHEKRKIALVQQGLQLMYCVVHGVCHQNKNGA